MFFLLFFSVAPILSAPLSMPYNAVTIRSVADLFGHPLRDRSRYDRMPVAGSQNLCPRMHQLVFNETVQVIKETHEECCVRIPHLFYITEKNKNPQHTYWTAKEYLMPLDQLPENIVPRTIDFQNPPPDEQTVVLIQPFHSADHNTTFSAGTRFVLQSCTPRGFVAVAWQPEKKEVVRLVIPKTHALIQTKRTEDEQRKTFLKVLRSWAHTQFIAYVWGGCSFVHTHAGDFLKKETDSGSYYDIKGDTHTQKTGFDCAGLVARAAQAAGCAYYYKNTATLAAHLTSIESFQDLKAGDLLWIPGHVMVVSDLTKNKVIEARHYSQGYGKVHELPLRKIFKGIKTYKQLFTAKNTRQSLQRLDSKGTIIQEIKAYKLLRLPTC